MTISKQRAQDIIDALRRGTVPQYGLDALAVGLGFALMGAGRQILFNDVTQEIRCGSGSGGGFVVAHVKRRKLESNSGHFTVHARSRRDGACIYIG